MTISNHPVGQEELMAYLDGELHPEDAALMASHLEHCPECQRLDAELQDISEMLMAWQVEESEHGSAEITEALKTGGSRVGSAGRFSWREFLDPRRWPKPVWGLAGMALTVLFALTLSFLRMRMNAPSYRFRDSVPVQMQSQDRLVGKAQDVNGALSGASEAKVPAPMRRSSGAGGGLIGKLQKTEDLDTLQTADNVESDGQLEPDNPSKAPVANGPMIIRTAELSLSTQQFDKTRSAIEEILKRNQGHIGELNVETPPGSARSLSGSLRVPSNRLDSVLSELRSLGNVENESQGGEEVTQQYVDLQARLANTQHTEQRLTDILRERTGKLSDVLAVEMQISRVRGEIEQMEAQRKTMKNQVDFATLTLTVTEAYKAELKAVPPSTGTQFHNAAVEGYRSLVDGIISVLLWLLSVGPTLLLWAAILFFPGRMMWRKLQDRRHRA